MIKVIVFDFDGTIVDSNGLKYEAFFSLFSSDKRYEGIVRRVLEDFREETRLAIIKRILLRYREEFSFQFEDMDIEVASYAKRYNDIVEEGAAACPEIPGARRSLELLSGQYPLYVNSVTPVGPLRQIISKRSLDPFFKDVCGAPGTKVENLKDILSREGVRGREALVVGDGQTDLESAKHFDAAFIGIRNNFNRSLRWKGGWLDDLRALPDVVVSMN